MALPIRGLTIDLFLILGGAVTALPLLLFTAAAKRLPYSTLGFLQYIAPSLQFLLAVLAFGEPFGRTQAICFAAIWTALAIFSVGGATPRPAPRRRCGLSPAPIHGIFARRTQGGCR